MAIPYLQVRNEQPGFHRTLADLPALAADFGSTDPRLSHLGLAAGQGRRLADLRRARLPRARPPRPRADRGGRRLASTGGRRRLAAIAGARARARRPRARDRRGADRLAPLRAVPAALRVRARLGGTARHRTGVGGRAARGRRARRLRRARGRPCGRRARFRWHAALGDRPWSPTVARARGAGGGLRTVDRATRHPESSCRVDEHLAELPTRAACCTSPRSNRAAPRPRRSAASARPRTSTAPPPTTASRRTATPASSRRRG